MHHILIGTDSRGAYFEDFLSHHNLFPNDWEIYIDVAPGGTIKTISEKLLTKVKTLPVTINSQILIMIADGICNLTVKKKKSGRYVLLYPEEKSSDRVKQVQTEISQAVENFHCYNVVLKFATIPPASLLNVANHFSHTFSQEDSQILLNEQKKLEYDVDLQNSFIMSVNTINGTRTVRWDKDLVNIHSKRRGTNKKLKKVVHYRYVALYDGLHPHMSLSAVWFDVMCDSINRDLPCAVANENKVVDDEAYGVVEGEDLGVVEDEDLSVAEVDDFSVAEELDMVVEEEEENDSWDFKRIV